MKRMILLLMTVALLHGSSESFYKKKYDYYAGKEKKCFAELHEMKEAQWDTYQQNQKIIDLNNQIYGAIRDSLPEEIEMDKQESIADQEYINTKRECEKISDKIMELQFTVEEKLQTIPKWFKEDRIK